MDIFLTFVLTGTFAVTSLMVGSVVQRGYDKYSKEINTQTRLNDTLQISNHTSNYSTITPTDVMTDQDHLADPIKVGMAMSVTFLSGLFQVRSC